MPRMEKEAEALASLQGRLTSLLVIERLSQGSLDIPVHHHQNNW